LDQRNFEHCAGREDSLVNLLDGHRSFVVSVNTFNGVQFSAQYNWTVGMWYLFAA
jgi:tRNA U54 and U55 pseudouridine synthase Pus10